MSITYVSEHNLGKGVGFSFESRSDGGIAGNEILQSLYDQLPIQSIYPRCMSTDLEDSTVGSVGHVELSNRVGR